MEYLTSDIVLAATLKCHNYKCSSITISGNKGTFSFTDVPQSFLLDFDLDNIKVSPLQFNNFIKQLTTSVKRMTNGK